jgi:hypothetical protein
VDYDGDGRLDFLTGSISGKVYLYRRKPNGAFSEPEVLQQQIKGLLGTGRAPINSGRPSTVAMADWYGSGKLDLFVGTGDGYVYVFRNEGTRQKPLFQKGERLTAGGKPLAAEGGNAGPFVADWDQDGKPDLLLGCGSGKVVWCRNTGNKTDPTLAAPVTLVEANPVESVRTQEVAHTPTRSGSNAKVCVADWNGDNLPDLVVGDFWVVPEKGVNRAHGWVWVYLRKPAETVDSKTQ